MPSITSSGNLLLHTGDPVEVQFVDNMHGRAAWLHDTVVSDVHAMLFPDSVESAAVGNRARWAIRDIHADTARAHLESTGVPSVEAFADRERSREMGGTKLELPHTLTALALLSAFMDITHEFDEENAHDLIQSPTWFRAAIESLNEIDASFPQIETDITPEEADARMGVKYSSEGFDAARQIATLIFERSATS